MNNNMLRIFKKMPYLKQQIYFIIIKIFVKTHIYKVLSLPARFFDSINQMTYFSKWVAQNPIEFSNFDGWKRGLAQKFHEHVFTYENLSEPIDFFEFGVAKGESFRWWVEMNTHEDSHFWGFDTFVGLPEDWHFMKKGTFSTDGHFPSIDDKRVTFIKGLFQESLPLFLHCKQFKHRKVFHLDADLFSSTLVVLTQLFPHIKAGDILIFDELKDVRHEFRAFKLFTESFYLKYQVLGGINNFCQVAIKIL